MSPTSRNKNKIGFTKESQSKIPTLSPLGKRSKNTQDTDGSVAEAADQIRSGSFYEICSITVTSYVGFKN